jgi:hypothetical protein
MNAMGCAIRKFLCVRRIYFKERFIFLCVFQRTVYVVVGYAALVSVPCSMLLVQQKHISGYSTVGLLCVVAVMGTSGAVAGILGCYWTEFG